MIPKLPGLVLSEHNMVAYSNNKQNIDHPNKDQNSGQATADIYVN